MTAPLPPLPGWMHIVLTIDQRAATRDFAKLAVREALTRVDELIGDEQAYPNQPECRVLNPVLHKLMGKIEAMLKEYE